MYKRNIIQCRTLLLIMIMLISTCIFAGQVYADGTNITQGKTATSKPVADNLSINISHMAPYGPSRAVDGDTGALSRWQTRRGVDGSYLQVDLGAVHAIDRWVVYNQSYQWNNDPVYAMKAYKLQKSNDGQTFTDVDTVLGNTLSVTDRPVTKFIARYLRVQVIEGSLDANSNHWDCILEFQAFGNPSTKPYVNTTTATSITSYSATVSGEVASDGYADITERGFVYSTTVNPEIGGADVNTAIVAGTTGTFSHTITAGLVKNTQYYYRAYAKNIMGTTYGALQSFTTLDLRANISAPQALEETTLDNMTIIANITGDTFADNILAASNFILSNAPTGLTVESVQYDSATQCTLNLAYDGTDFDTDISNLTLNVKGAELVSNCDLAASDNLTVTALNDDEAIAIANNSQIAEGEESGGEITITLTGGTFAPSLSLGKWTVSNLPAGVTPGSITRDSSTGARIVLAGNSTEDYDADITDITVSCTPAEYSDSMGGAVLTQNSGVTFTARNEPSDIVLSMASVDENQASGTVVGILSTIDSDVGDTFTYSLVSGLGDTDNGSFTIQDDELLTNEVFDYETRNIYDIRVKTVDSFGSAYEESLQINIADVYEIPNVTSISIKTQPALVYTEGDSLDLGTLAVTLHMDNGMNEDITFADFAANGIATDTANGKVLALADDGSKITVTHTASGQSVQTYSLTVNAPQIITYTVTFVDWDGHTIDTQTINEGSNATAPSDPTRAGYIFISWDKAFNNITSNLTVTAVYIEDIPAVTDADKVAQDIAALNIGFATGDSEKAVTKDITLEEVGSVYSSDITWTSDNEAIEISGDTGVVTRPVFSAGDEDVTVTARVYNNGASDIKDFHLNVLALEPVMYTVTFNKNGGSTEASPNSKTAVAGESIDALPAVPTRSGYTFEGWNTAENGSGTVFTASTVITGDITVYAQWAEVPKDNDDKDGYSSGGSGSKGSNSTPPTPPDTGSSPGTTTTTATIDRSGNLTAAVTLPQLNKAIKQAVEEAARQGNGAAVKVEINVTAPAGAKSAETSIPKAAVSTVGDGRVDTLTIKTPIAAITFDGNALDTISKEAAEDVEITVSKVDSATLSEETKQTVGGRPVFDFRVTSGDKTISQFGGNVEVAVPYTPKAGEDTSAIVIYYITAEGKLEIVSNCVYDPATGTISFSTNHFSQYAVGYNKVSFKDVAVTAPYSKAVSFIAARSITSGTGNGNFNPEASITRGQFLVMVMNAYGIEPDKDPNNNFTDAGNTYYTEYLAAAKRLGLSNGIGNNMYAPEKDMTQQEMVTLLYNTLKTISELPASAEGKELSSYSDSDQIAEWAKDAMTLFVKAGIITGSENRLAPAGNANRAQMAQLLYNLMTK